MYLSNIKFWNFRKFGDPNDELDMDRPHLCLDLKPGVNLLVGENDSGKSCIVDAIKLVLKTHSWEWIKFEEDDFFHGSNRLRIECVFRGLEDIEAKNFTEWLGVGEFINENGQTLKVPYLRLILDVKKTPDKILPYEIRGGVDNDGRPVSAEAREYLKATFLKPLRDAKAELIARRNSRLSQILYTHPLFEDKENHDLVKILVKTNEDIMEYFENETNKDKNGFEILNTLRTYLASFLSTNSTQKAKFDIDNPNLKNILEILRLTLDDYCSGLGIFNLLFIAAELLHLKRKNYEGLKLGLIEEVEAHLHPQAQLRVMEALEKESSENDVQLILTSHSPNLASKVHISDLILCHEGNVYPLGPKYSKLEETDYAFLERFLDVTKANLFFAQGVILVEGDAENILIPTFARVLDKDLSSHGVSIVNVGGLTFLRYSRIFQRKDGLQELKLPVSIITDLDVKPENEAAHKTTKMAGKKEKYDGSPVKTFISPHWTFEYCMALSHNIRELLFESIKRAGDEMQKDGQTGRQIIENWSNFSSGLNDQDLAKKIYDIITSKKISKAIVAQYLAKQIEEKRDDEDFIANLMSDTEIKYLIEAIDYAASNDNN